MSFELTPLGDKPKGDMVLGDSKPLGTGAFDLVPIADAEPIKAVSTWDTVKKTVGNEFDYVSNSLKTAYNAMSNVNPDNTSDDMKLSQKTGIPIWVIQANDENRKSALEVQDKLAANGNDWRRTATSYPATAQWMLNPQNMSVAKDDVPNLEQHEGIFGSFGRGFKSGDKQVDLANLAYKQMLGDNSALLEEKIKKLEKEMSEDKPPTDFVKGGIYGAAQMLPQLWESIRKGNERGLAGALMAGGAAVALGQMGPQIALPEEIVTVPVASGAAYTAGILTGGAETSFKMESALAYREFINIKDKNGVSVDPDVAKMAAAMVGTANAGLEFMQLKWLAQSIPGGKEMIAKMSREGMKEILRNKTYGAAFVNFAKGYTGIISKETATEVLQEGITILGREGSKNMGGVNNPVADSNDDYMNRLIDTGIQSAQAFTFLTLPGPSMNFVRDTRAAVRGETNQAVIGALGDSAAASKLRERLPEAYQAFVKDIKDKHEGSISDIYIPVTQFSGYFQDKTDKVVSELGIDKQYAEAVLTGGDVRIPIEVYQAKLAATEHHKNLMPDLKLDVNDMTAREAEEFRGKQQEYFQNEVAEAQKQLTNDAANSSDLEYIRANIKGQLMGTGKVTSADAEAYAAIYTARASVVAQQLGIKPKGWYDNLGLTISVGQDGQVRTQTLGRDKTMTTAAQNQDGNTISFLHGSNNPDLTLENIQITGRDSSKQGKGTDKFGGLYVVTPEDAAAAEHYSKMAGGSPTVYQIHLDPNAKIMDINVKGGIERLSKEKIDELVAAGYSAVRGPNTLGTTIEYSIINKAAIVGMNKQEAPVVQQGVKPLPVDNNVEDYAGVKENVKQGANNFGAYLQSLGLNPVITSGKRSIENNTAVNGAANSYHLSGDAIDISLGNLTQEQQYEIETKAREAGWGEVLYHDAGSGVHLHLANLKGGETGFAQPTAPVSQRTLVENIRVAIFGQESGGDITAYNPDGDAYGKYQFQPGTWDAAAKMSGREDLVGVLPNQASEADQDAVANGYLDSLMKRYNNDVRYVAAAWYAGETNADRYFERGSFPTEREGGGKYPSVNEYVNEVAARMGAGGISSKFNQVAGGVNTTTTAEYQSKNLVAKDNLAGNNLINQGKQTNNNQSQAAINTIKIDIPLEAEASGFDGERFPDYKAAAKKVVADYGDKIVLETDNGNRAMVVHPSTKEDGKWQGSFIDNKGPFMDIQRDTKEQVVADALEQGYTNLAHQGNKSPMPGVFYQAAKNKVLKYPMEKRDLWWGEANYKNEGGQLVSVTPDEFLAKSKPLVMDRLTRENVDDIKQHIQDGHKLDPLTLYGTDTTNVKHSDGRHRAIAAKELGIKQVPVVDYTNTLKDTSTYNQSAVGDQLNDLVAIHNLNAANIDFAADFGGIPVPSIAITKKDISLTGYGDITLIGNKEMIDPSKTPVFSADAYSMRFPPIVWPKVPTRLAQAVVDKYRSYFKAVDKSVWLDQSWDYMVNNPDRDKAISNFKSSGSILAFMHEVKGLDYTVPMRNMSFESIYLQDPKFVEVVRAIGDDIHNMKDTDPRWAKISKAAKAAVTRVFKAKYNTKAGRDLTAKFLEKDFNENGNMYYGPFSKMTYGIDKVGKQEIDAHAARQELETMVEPFANEYNEWVANIFAPLFTKPQIKVGQKNMPLTLNNVVDAMTSAQVKNKENTITYGPGQLKAAVSSRFKSLDELRAKKERLISPKEEGVANKDLDVLLEKFRNAASPFYLGQNWRGEIDVWNSFDDSMKSLAQAQKKGGSLAAVKAALKKNDFSVVDNEVAQVGVDALKKVAEGLTDYFEAKPQRAVSLSEFSGAVVPINTPIKTRSNLEAAGVPIVEYDPSVEGSRQAAIESFYNKPNILFQSAAWHGTPHSFDKFSLDHMGSGEGEQAFGWGLYFASDKKIAEWYKDTLAPKPSATFDGKTYATFKHEGNEIIAIALQALEENAGTTDVAKGIKRVEESFKEIMEMTQDAIDDDPEVEQINSAIKWLNDNAGKITLQGDVGKLYEVSLAPDAEDMLDWNKPLSQQSERVKNILSKKPKQAKSFIVKEFVPTQFFKTPQKDFNGISLPFNVVDAKTGEIFDMFATKEAAEKKILSLKNSADAENIRNSEMTGKEIYGQLEAKFGSDEEASKYLNSIGIPGLKYLDGTSRTGRKNNYNYVIFDDQAIEIVNTFDQAKKKKTGEVGKRGSIEFGSNGKTTIQLFAAADRSTFLHETGHLFLNDMENIILGPDAPAAVIADFETVKEYLGVTPDQIGADGRVRWTVEQHEMYARTFEGYLREGKAPNTKLQKVFQNFKRWLTNIYRNVKSLNMAITPEIREVMDRMLATENEIKQAENFTEYNALIDAEAGKGISFADYNKYLDLMVEAKGMAEETLLSKLMSEVSGEKKAAQAAQRAQLQEDILKEVQDMPVYKSLELLRTGELKLSTQELVDQFGEDVVAQLPADIHSEASDLTADDVADILMFYTSGDEMIQTILAARPIAEEVQDQVDYSMAAEEASAMDNGQIKQMALNAIHNTKRLDMMALEVSMLDLLVDQGKADNKTTILANKEMAKALEQVKQQNIDNHVLYLVNNSLMGVEKKGAVMDAEGNATGEWYAGFSNNEPWYADIMGIINKDGLPSNWGDFIKDFKAKKKPIEKMPAKMREVYTLVAEDHLKKGYETTFGEVPPDESHAAIISAINEVNGLIEAAGNLAAPDPAPVSAEQATQMALDLQTNQKERLANALSKTRAIKAAAKTIISNKAYADAIKASEYFTAERRSAARAEAAYKAGKYDAAADAKEQQMLNHALAMEAIRVKTEVDKMRRYFTKFDSNKKMSIDMGYRDQIDELLERFDFKKRSAKIIKRREGLAAWITSQEAAGEVVTITDKMKDAAFKIHFSKLTIDEMRDLNDAIKNIEHLGRLKNKLLTNKNKRDFQEAKDNLVASIFDNNKITKGPGVNPNQSGMDKLMHKLRFADASLRKIEFIVRRLDGDAGQGEGWNYLFRPIEEAEETEIIMREEASKNLKAIFAKHYSAGEYSRWKTKKIYVSEVKDQIPFFTKENIISLALNWGNEGNKQRVRDAYAWDDAKVQAIFDNMTKNDWDFVQDVWNMVNTYFPAMDQLTRDVAGIKLPKVDAAEVKTQYGTYAGGYYPIKYDPRLSEQAFAQDEAQRQKDFFENQFYRAGTKQGHTKDRAAAVKDRPIKLDLGVLSEHLTNVIHDLAYRRAIRDVDKMLRNKEVREALTSTIGSEAYHQFNPWLQAIGNENKAPATYIDGLLGKARMGATVAAMGLKITTAIAQPVGAFNFMPRIGMLRTVQALAAFYSNPMGKVDFVIEKSAFMRTRSTNFERDVHQTMKNLIDAGKWSRMQETFFMHIAIMDQSITVPVWINEYNHALLETNGNEEMAIRKADALIRQTQGSGSVKDLAAIQRGSEKDKMFTMFYSYFSAAYNMYAESIHSTKKMSDIPKFVASAMYLWFFPALLGELVTGRGPGDDDDTEEKAKWAIKTILLYPFQTIPFARDVINAAGSGFEYKMSPVSGVFSSLVKAMWAAGDVANKGQDKDYEKLALHSAETISYFTGIPWGQIKITTKGFYDWIEDGAKTSDINAELIRNITLGKKYEKKN